MVVSPSARTDVWKLNFEGRHRRLRETTFQLLTIFGTFPATKLELLSLTTCNRRIPLDYLPESLKTIELSLFSYTKKNGNFPLEFIEKYCQRK